MLYTKGIIYHNTFYFPSFFSFLWQAKKTGNYTVFIKGPFVASVSCRIESHKYKFNILLLPLHLMVLNGLRQHQFTSPEKVWLFSLLPQSFLNHPGRCQEPVRSWNKHIVPSCTELHFYTVSQWKIQMDWWDLK